MTGDLPGKSQPQFAAHGVMFFYAALISTSFPVGAVITPYLDPAVLTFLRFALAAGIFAVVILLRGEWVWPRPEAFLRYGLISLSITVFFVTMFEALRTTAPLSGGALFTLVPLMTAGFAFLLLGESSGRRQLALLVLGAAGALWVLFQGDLRQLLTIKLGPGERIFFVGCLAFSIYSPAIKRLHRGESVMLLSFWTIVMGAVILGFYAWSDLVAISWSHVPAKVWLGIAYLAVFTTCITFSLIKFASLKLAPQKVMAYTYLTPSFVALWEGLRGQGWPDPSVAGGILLTFLTMVLLQITADPHGARRR